MSKDFTEEDEALLSELGVAAEPSKAARGTPREERIIAGFEEIQSFVEAHGRVPQHGERRGIFERIYAVRLDRIRKQEKCRRLIAPIDHQALLTGETATALSLPDNMDDDALLAELGIEAEAADITELRHVRSTAEKRAAAEVATRRKCEDFETFRPLFEQVQKELDMGIRETRPVELKAEIKPGRFFIVGGQKAYVAEMGKQFTQQYGNKDARLRVIFDNGTENNMLRRSLQRALHKDAAGRRITDATAGPLFTGQTAAGDEASGTIYVLQSKSNLPFVAENRDLVHKIGVTNASVEERIAGAMLEPTFLMADVEVVATYKLYNINRNKLENLIHRIFAPVRLEIEIKDRFGNPVVPREWFLVPLGAIDDAVEKIQEGTITQYCYDAKTASLIG